MNVNDMVLLDFDPIDFSRTTGNPVARQYGNIHT